MQRSLFGLEFCNAPGQFFRCFFFLFDFLGKIPKGFLQAGTLDLFILHFGIFRQLCFQLGYGLDGLLHLGLMCCCFVLFCFQPFQPLVFQGKVFLCLFLFLLGCFSVFGHCQLCRDCFLLLIQLFDLAQNLLLRSSILLDQLFHQLYCLGVFQLAFFRLAHFQHQHIVRVAGDAIDILANAAADFFVFLSQLAGLLFQALLQLIIALGAEDFLKDLFTVLGGGKQKFQKIALCDHGDLGKLAAVNAHDIHNGLVYLFQPGDHPPIGIVQLGVGFFGGIALAAGLGPVILRVSLDGVDFLRIGKGKLHLGGGGGLGVFGAEHIDIAGVAACLAV